MRQKALVLLGLCLCCINTTLGGVLHGTVYDATIGTSKSGILPGASVYIDGRNNAGAETDELGKYSITLPDGKYTVCCEFLGYKKYKKEVKIKGNTLLDIILETNTEELSEVVISSTSAQAALEMPQMSVSKIEVKELKRMPAMFGEQDVIKSLQLMPGVKSESDASGGFQVRGGESSQNLVLFDGATINNSGHLLGFFSAFNSDLLRDVTLYKGALPAQYGGRSSAVLDINSINGDYNKFKGDGSIGILASKLTLQGPIQKGKSSFYVAGRRTYLDMFLKAKEDMKDTKLNFYDMNAKLSFKLGERDYMFASFFNSHDCMGLKDIANIDWGNTVGTGKWWHQFNKDVDLSSTVFFSRYKTKMGMDISDMDVDYHGRNDQTSLNEDLRLKLDSAHTTHIGWQTSYYDVISSEWEYNGSHEKEERYGWENCFWANDEWKISKRWSASYGIRLSLYSVLGGSPYYEIDKESGDILNTTNYSSKTDVVKKYHNWEPRISFNYKVSNHQSVKAAYARASQNVHTIKEGISSMPVDRMTLNTNLIKPETSDQVSLGYAATIPNEEKGHLDEYSLETEVYYKKMDNILDYREGLQNETYTESDRLLLSGQGRSYGIEFNIKKNHGKLTGWISYTLSKTESQIEGLNDGRWYLANSDRRHSINVVAIYAPSKKWDFSAAWTFNSGQALSLPTGKYEINGKTCYYYESKNNYRAPNYHRLDLSATRHGKEHKRWQSEWSFGIYNVYARYNPFMIQFSDDEESPTGTKATQISLFSIVPSVSYRFKF